MHLLSVNRGSKLTHMKGAEPEITGIYKSPILGPVPIGALGIADDFIGDSKNHGGPDQAIYVYGGAEYKWWESELGRTLLPGTFGENLTISEFESAQWAVGDRLQVGTVVLQVTAPRTPCATLAARMGDPRFVKMFRDAELPGLYCRVLTPGQVQADDSVVRIPWQDAPVTILEMFRFHYQRNRREDEMRRLLRAPISMRARVSIERDLKMLLQGPER